VEILPVIRSDDCSTVQVETDGRVLAEADVRPGGEPGVVVSAMHVESGHLPLGVRSRLVDAVLALPLVVRAERLVASVPIGDAEMLDRMRERSSDIQAHYAGATTIVEARLVPRPR
jgi:hypothetical protein